MSPHSTAVGGPGTALQPLAVPSVSQADMVGPALRRHSASSLSHPQCLPSAVQLIIQLLFTQGQQSTRGSVCRGSSGSSPSGTDTSLLPPPNGTKWTHEIKGTAAFLTAFNLHILLTSHFWYFILIPNSSPSSLLLC